MQIVYSCCCGLDVHKKSITACVLWAEARGEKRKEKRVFGTFTRDPLKLSDGCESAVSDRLLSFTLHTAPRSVVARKWNGV